MRTKLSFFAAVFLCAATLTGQVRAAIKPCGEHPLEQAYPSLVWKKFVDVAVRSRFADVDAMICVGKVPSSPVADRVTYRDSDGLTKVSRTVEELREFQVLITSRDLPGGISGMVRSGSLVALRIGEPTTDGDTGITRYPVAVRFHRALGRGVAADIREITLEARLDYERDSSRAERGGQAFDVLKMYIGIMPIRMEQIVLKEGATTVDNFFTSTLERVGSLE